MSAEQLAELAVVTVLANQRDPTHQTAKKILTRAFADAFKAQRERFAALAERWTDPDNPPEFDTTGCAAAFNEGLCCSAAPGIARAIRQG